MCVDTGCPRYVPAVEATKGNGSFVQYESSLSSLCGKPSGVAYSVPLRSLCAAFVTSDWNPFYFFLFNFTFSTCVCLLPRPFEERTDDAVHPLNLCTLYAASTRFLALDVLLPILLTQKSPPSEDGPEVESQNTPPPHTRSVGYSPSPGLYYALEGSALRLENSPACASACHSGKTR